VLTVVPRPNQAFWTLSALWAAWLWDREAALPIKVALRRRRYDWGWHAGALRAALAGVMGILPRGTETLAFLPEAEPGYLAAALAGLDGAGLELGGIAARFDQGQAMVHWRSASPPPPREPDGHEQEIGDVVVRTLRDKKEPCAYPVLHAAVWTALAQQHKLAPLLPIPAPGIISAVNASLHKVLEKSPLLIRLDQKTEVETGLFWLRSPPPARFDSYTDRVELALVDILRRHDDVLLVDLDAELCSRLPGLDTPDGRLIMSGLESYAALDVERDCWRLREEDRAQARAEDVREMHGLLGKIAEQLGLTAQGEDPILWTRRGTPVIAFRVRESATLSGPWLDDLSSPDCFVLPGGRAPLISERLRRDPRLRAWMQGRPRLVKFRHLRRLAEDPTLDRENFLSRLGMDPAEHEDPQMTLL
jgi:hypothetical protein